MIVQRIRFVRNQQTSIDIYNLTELALFVETTTSMRENCVRTLDMSFGSWFLSLIICSLSLSYVFPETEFYFIPIFFFLWRFDDGQDLQFRQFFLQLSKCIIDDIFLQFQLIRIAKHLPFTASTPDFP